MDREKVIQGLDQIVNDPFMKARADYWVLVCFEAIAMLKEQDAVVRCKDCRYGQFCTDGETTYQCFKWNSNEFGALHEQDWFCADGRR